ncbi:hypothetical protein CVT26_011440 [Gymnopilus dilepis]|uniref:Uncharacterized protein n=1 Tax=Gymnopilus dilepis TaxID=231916 RepID=A0A409YQJ1_9AGAR|nr:hypothetical protein CVT26_011440 [Gymnopilus dilepis]
MNPNQPPYHAGILIALPPPYILNQVREGKYGISYDLFTRPMEDPLPFGWAAHRATVYKNIGRFMRSSDYEHAQYSVWQKIAIPTNVWQDMVTLRRIKPRGVLASTVRAMQMFRIPRDVFIVTQEIALGGAFSPGLIGPTPRMLAQNAALPTRHMPPGWPANPGELPQGTRCQGHFMVTSSNGANWRRP